MDHFLFYELQDAWCNIVGEEGDVALCHRLIGIIAPLSQLTIGKSPALKTVPLSCHAFSNVYIVFISGIQGHKSDEVITLYALF